MVCTLVASPYQLAHAAALRLRSRRGVFSAPITTFYTPGCRLAVCLAIRFTSRRHFLAAHTAAPHTASPSPRWRQADSPDPPGPSPARWPPCFPADEPG